jgi:hypothetical protein
VKYQQDLQVRLQERYRRLYKVGSSLYTDEAGYLVAFIRATPALRYLIEDIQRAEPELDPGDWVANHFSWNKSEWPATEEGRAKVAWHLLQEWAQKEHGAAMFGHILDRSQSSMDAGARTATETVIEPLVEFLQERIGKASDVLYLLERYVRRVEWFEKQNLYEQFCNDTRRGEATYDRDLRRFLFEQGVDYPFSQPKSASGQSDVVGNLDGDDPLVCEVKLFDGDQYSKRYIAKGVHQAISYARDYSKITAYLVVFNLSEKVLQFLTEGPVDDWPPRIEAGGVTLFLVEVRALPKPSASARGPVQLVTVTKEDLLREEATEAD